MGPLATIQRAQSQTKNRNESTTQSQRQVAKGDRIPSRLWDPTTALLSTRSTVDMLTGSQYCHSPWQSAKNSNDTSPAWETDAALARPDPKQPLLGPWTKQVGVSSDPRRQVAQQGDSPLPFPALCRTGFKRWQMQAPSAWERPSQRAACVLTYQGFHSTGSGATMPSLANHISSGSLTGSIPISLANSRISARRGKRMRKEKSWGCGKEKKNQRCATVYLVQ